MSAALSPSAAQMKRRTVTLVSPEVLEAMPSQVSRFGRFTPEEVLDALDQLPERPRRILSLRFGLTGRARKLREIGQDMGLSMQQVAGMVRTALRHLRKYLCAPYRADRCPELAPRVPKNLELTVKVWEQERAVAVALAERQRLSDLLGRMQPLTIGKRRMLAKLCQVHRRLGHRCIWQTKGSAQSATSADPEGRPS
jgi:hypothetical protein